MKTRVKQQMLWKWSALARWFGLSLLLVAVLAACSDAGSPNFASVPTTTSAQTHLSSIVAHLKGRQQGQVTMFSLPDKTIIRNLVSISSGSASAIWFGEYDTNRIGTLDAQGQLTEYTLPTANAQPGWGVQGPHGDFWVSEEGVNRIAEISAQGDLTEYTLPTANAQPGRLAFWGRWSGLPR